MSLPTIPEFFRDKNIFITGGSGFIGKVLIEKLLRSCPQIGTIYLLLREKKGKSSEERIKTITDLPLFDVLKEQDPKAVHKIKAVNGDVSQLGLGLSPKDRALLIKNTHLIYHGAASVRFDDPLSEAVAKNLRGTRELVNLALEIPQLAALVHISTTYGNTDRHIIDEELYPAHADWRETIEIAEKTDPKTLNILTLKYIAPMPNTYTFTKQLAEHVVVDLTENKIPTIIFRPSIVISSAKEPFPGWIDNFNGPIGLLTASGKGVVRSVYANRDTISDYIPVDVVTKALIISAWKQATLRDKSERLRTSFYNASKNGIAPITMGQMCDMGMVITEEVPFNDILWYPNGSVTYCYPYHYLRVLFYQVLPALLVDGLLKLSGRKPFLVSIQRKIYVATTALMYYMQRDWQFLNANAEHLEKELLPEDFKAFSYDREELEDVMKFFKAGNMGARRYLFKETDDTLPQAKIRQQWMWYAFQALNILWYTTFAWIIFVKLDILGFGMRKLQDSYIFLTTE